MRGFEVKSWRQVLIAGALASVFGGCAAYYPSYHYAPKQEIHLLRTEDGNEQARVEVEVVGILRPEDQAPRRLHARMRVENPQSDPLTFHPGEVRATPGGVMHLEPEPRLDSITVDPGADRSVELFFPLPDRDDLPDQALEEIQLEWSVALRGQPHVSRARFQRTRRPPYYGQPAYFGGPYFYEGFYYGPNPWRPWGFYGHYRCW